MTKAKKFLALCLTAILLMVVKRTITTETSLALLSNGISQRICLILMVLWTIVKHLLTG